MADNGYKATLRVKIGDCEFFSEGREVQITAAYDMFIKMVIARYQSPIPTNSNHAENQD